MGKRFKVCWNCGSANIEQEGNEWICQDCNAVVPRDR